MHAVAPLALTKVPASQLLQVPCPACGCTVPGMQLRIAVEASRHAWPSSQVVHSDCDTKPEPLPNDPSAHGAALALTLPASQK